MQLLDSRASRMPPGLALLTLHADYIGGEHANYRKWFFAAQLDLDDPVGQTLDAGLNRLPSISRHQGNRAYSEKSLNRAMERWRQAMNDMSQYDRIRQIALYLLCWGEAAQVRFVPECLCFIFKCADDYYRSSECQNRAEHVSEGLYLRTVIKPLYRFIRDQGYEVVDGKFVKREKDHEDIIGYDDVNQLFWYPEGISRIFLKDKDKVKFCLNCNLISQRIHFLLDTAYRLAAVTAVHEVRAHRLGPCLLQNILREAIIRSSTCQL